MPIDLSQAISGGTTAPASSPPSGISLDSLYKNVKPAQSNVASSLAGKVWDSAKAVAVQTGRDWYSEWTNEIDQYESAIRTNLKQLPTEADYNNPERVTRNPVATLGSLLLNIGSLVATPFRATVEAGPVRVAQSVAKPVYKATKTDPDEQAMINEFMENVIQIGAGLIGGVPEASAGREAAVDFTKLSDSDQAMLRRGPKPRYRVVGTAANGKPIMRQVLPGGAAEAPKPVPTIAKASSIAMNAFDELAMKSESAAKTVAAQVEKTHPVAGKALAKRAEEKAKAPLEEQVATGEVSARDAATGWDTEPGSIRYWDDLNSRMTLDLSAHTANFERGGITVSSKKLLSTLRDRAQSGSNEYVNSLLEKIANRAPDLPVHFRRMLQDETGADRSDIAGWYIHRDTMRGETVVSHTPDHIEVRTEGVRNPIKTLVHELVHSATVKFMEENPEHPVTKEIERLYDITKARFSKMPELSGEETKGPYGIANPKEFVAEALSNPDFQDWLIYSEGYKLPGERMYKSLWSRFTTALHKVFGIKDPMEAQLLHATTRISTHIMDLQVQGAMNAAAEGASKAAATAYRLGDRGDAFEVLRKFPQEKLGMGVVEGKVKEYWRFLLNNIAPESLGIEAKKAGATIAEAIAKRVQDDVQLYERGKVRRDFWMKNQGLQKQFIDGLERGEDFRDPTLKSAAKAYSAWTKAIVEQDHSLGIEYDPVDHYVPHIFKDPQAVEEWAQQRFGVSWTKPGFTKDRSFDLYSQAIKAGFEPRYTNPEDIMQARQQASNMARMKVETLDELERQGLAVKSLPKDNAPAWLATKYPSPNGDSFWVHKNAAQVLHNAFNSRSLWSMRGPVGDAFRGLMWMKNKMVPIRLAASLFHPLHIATIHNVTGMVRASKELFAGKISPLEWGGKMAKEMTVVWSNIEDSRLGSRIMKAYKGKIAEGELTETDRQSLQYLVEGGITPEMSMVYRGRSMEKFHDAVLQHSAKAIFHAPYAAIESVQGLVFQKWIPNLKVASYLKDVKTAIAANPELAGNADARRLALRKLAKSVDNRYGEMAYNTLFWNRWVKDLAVANTLSLGWQLGFMREFGGGAIDAGRAALSTGSVAEKAKSGLLDRSMFSTYYLTTTLGYGGLLTWAMTGKSPASLIDYIYPQTGETGPDGKPQRVSTMFYTRELASLYKHYEQEGAVSAISGIAKSKAVGQIGLINEWLEGVNDFGQEIRDPDAPAYKQLEQTLARTLVDLQPISVAGGEGKSGKDKILSGLGFIQAPKYADRSKGEGAIVETYSKYYAPKETPYDKALYSQDTQGLRQLYTSGDYDKFDSTLDAVQQKYNLTGTQVKRLVRTMAGGKGSYETMFQHFSFDQQKKILGKMTPEEREKYVPLVSRDHREEAEEAFEDQP